MDTPQEIEVWYVLPALRRALTLSMKKQGLKQNEIAKRLNLTEAAVSQYVSSKRAVKVSFNKKMKEKINAAAKKIKSNKDRNVQIQRLLRLSREEGVVCNLHKKYCECDGLEKCEVCLE
ncbi:MAG: helix-turn-helix domain-containing protein [archaeon]